MFHKHTFELVGYDFMVIGAPSGLPACSQTAPFEVRLIEVNTNPCLEESNHLLSQYIPRMIDDAFKIVLDPVFGTVPQPVSFSVDGIDDSVNSWELLGSINS